MNKEKNEKKGIWKPFLDLLKKTRLPYIEMLCAIAVTLLFSRLNLLVPQYTAKITGGDVSSETLRGLVLVLTTLALVTALRMYVIAWAKNKTTLSLRKTMLRKVLSLPVPYYDRQMADRLISRTTNDTTMLSDFVGSGIPYLPSAVYTLVATLLILFQYNWRLVVLQLFIVPVVLLMTILQGRIQFKWNRQIQARIAELTGYLAEILANIPLVKVFVKETQEEQRGQEKINELYQTKKKYAFALGGIQMMSSAENVIQTVLVVVGGAWLVNKGHITLPVWIAFYLYSSNLVGAMISLFDYWTRIKAVQGAASRIAEIVCEENETNTGHAPVPETIGDIEFRDVTFGYDQEPVLKHVHMTIPKGQVTALVGRSGAGKSTVFGLLERFYKPESGEVLVNGTDLADMDLAEWRKNIGYVSQNSPLFSGTIRENMVYGLGRDVSETELIKAAKDACLYDFIQTAEKGFDTEVGENGSKLSGGQRQRIAIANVLLKDPKILLLDEATSNLDAETAALSEAALKHAMAGRTTIMVTHDLASAETADYMVVLEQGEVAGCGTRQEVSSSCAHYQALKESLAKGGVSL